MKNIIIESDLLIDLMCTENGVLKKNRSKHRAVKTKSINGVNKTQIVLEKDNEYGKPEGEYITYETDAPFVGANSIAEGMAEDFKRLFRGKNNILIVGIGNNYLISDALGPIVVTKLEPPSAYTKKVYKITPNVEGNTGIESVDLINMAIALSKPDLVVVIDSLASRNFDRIGRSFQISTGGIVPGSGSGKRNQAELTEKTLGVPIVAIGVPIVVHFKSYLFELISTIELNKESSFKAYDFIGKSNSLSGVILAPKEVDMIVEYSASIIASAINRVLVKWQ